MEGPDSQHQSTGGTIPQPDSLIPAAPAERRRARLITPTATVQDKAYLSYVKTVEDYRRRFFVCVLLTMPIFLLAPLQNLGDSWLRPLAFEGSDYALLVAASLVFLYGGWPFLKGMVKEMHSARPTMMTLVAIALIVTYGYSSAVVMKIVPGKLLYTGMVTLVDVMLLGHWVAIKSILSAGQSLQELIQLLPQNAHRFNKYGVPEDEPVYILKKDDVLLVKAGEKFPVDGIVVEGESLVSEAMLSGEAVPVTKKKDDHVYGGALNEENPLTIRVTEIGDDMFVSQIIRMVQGVQADRSATQIQADKAAAWLTFIGLSAGLLTAFAWMGLSSKPFAFALERMAAVLIITCPPTLGLAIPLVVAVATTIGAGHGMLIRRRNAFEQARHIQAVVFDKTGTLTRGIYGVTEVVSFNKDVSKEEVHRLAASVEQHSEHALAKAIVHTAKGALQPVSDYRTLPGIGVEGKVDGHVLQVISNANLPINDPQMARLQKEGKTLVFVVKDDVPLGVIAAADMVHPEAAEAIRQLKELGMQCIMLTEDTKRVADAVAAEVGVEEVIADVPPEQKVAKIKEIQARGLKVAVVGDGVHDAAVLAQADTGIAIGAGTDVGIETADIILMKNNPMDVVMLISLAQQAFVKMKQNLIWGVSYNALAIPAAAGLFMWSGIVVSPTVGALLMSLSTVICAANARLLKLPGAKNPSLFD